MKPSTGLPLLVAALAAASPAAASPGKGPGNSGPSSANDRAPPGAARLLRTGYFTDWRRGNGPRDRHHGPRGHGWGYWNHGPGHDNPCSP